MASERSRASLWIGVALAVASGDPLAACPVCFGAADGPLLTSARTGVLVMAAITCVILTAFGVFFVRIARHVHAIERSERPNGAERAGSPAELGQS